MAATRAHAPRKRGRPPMASLSLDEVADALAWPAEALERVLLRCPGVLPGAEQGPSGWKVPERALRDLLGARTGPLPVMCSVEQAAAFVGKSPKTVYAWLKLRDPKTGTALLPSRMILGERRILAADVLKLPSAFPDWAPGRPRRPFSFFSANQTASNDEG